MHEEVNTDICCSNHVDGKFVRCEFCGELCCTHPNVDGFVLTATLPGARPANCPKLPGMAISDEEKERREKEREGRGESFRYGGFFHDYEMTAKETGADVCYVCHKDFGDEEKPYCRVFPAGEGRSRFGIICRKCAYSFGDGVIEADGETYTDYYAFSEERWKEGRRGNE